MGICTGRLVAVNKMDWDDDMEAWIQEQEELAGLGDHDSPPTAKTGESQCL